MTIDLPAQPMAPISVETLPTGADWGYQLKWDGVRLLSRLENGRIELFSRQLLNKTTLYPEAVEALEFLRQEDCLLDGEAVMFDPVKQRPNFSQVLQRERSGSVRTRADSQFLYVLFDLLHWRGEDLRSLPYKERHSKLMSLLPDKLPRLFITDLFTDRDSLWNWVENGGWEGVVGKRLSSPYREGKKHKDWYKKKIALILEVSINGLIIRGGHVASLVMTKDEALFGRVSLGLDRGLKARLLLEGLKRKRTTPYYDKLPIELKHEEIIWLDTPFTCTVTGLEITSAGQLRHPKIVRLHEFP